MEAYTEIREAVAKLCAGFPGAYWRALDREMAYPTAFVNALTESGYLSVLIPEAYGGSGLPLSAAPRSWRRSSGPAATGAHATRRCTRWARSSGTAPRRRRPNISRLSRKAACGSRPSG